MKWNEPGRQAGARKEGFVDYSDGFYVLRSVVDGCGDQGIGGVGA